MLIIERLKKQLILITGEFYLGEILLHFSETIGKHKFNFFITYNIRMYKYIYGFFNPTTSQYQGECIIYTS